MSLSLSVDEKRQKIDTLSIKHSVCGYQSRLDEPDSIVTYESFLHTDTNLGGHWLDLETGKCFKREPKIYRFTIFLGVFTSPISGTWSISYSFYSDVHDGDVNK